jgi:hypothetical protein
VLPTPDKLCQILLDAVTYSRSDWNSLLDTALVPSTKLVCTPVESSLKPKNGYRLVSVVCIPVQPCLPSPQVRVDYCIREHRIAYNYLKRLGVSFLNRDNKYSHCCSSLHAHHDPDTFNTVSTIVLPFTEFDL